MMIVRWSFAVFHYAIIYPNGYACQYTYFLKNQKMPGK